MIKDNNKDSYIASTDSVTVYTNGRMYSVKQGNMNYDLIKSKCMRGDYTDIEILMNPLLSVEKKSKGKLKVVENDIYYKNDKLDETLKDRLLEIVQDGHGDLTPMLKFIKNTYKNPSYNSRKMLYKFIANRQMPITKEGMIIGYKGVSGDYLDKHSGEYSNVVGSTNEMDRALVDDNPDNHCSAGFHIGSKNYADSWGGCDGKLMLAEYNPKHAVAVPNDHNCEKLRVCKYTIIGEVATDDRNQDIFKSKIYDSENHIDVMGSVDHDTELSHPDVWYKARNWIETNRDNGISRIRIDALRDKFPTIDTEFTNDDWYELEDTCSLSKVHDREDDNTYFYL